MNCSNFRQNGDARPEKRSITGFSRSSAGVLFLAPRAHRRPNSRLKLRVWMLRARLSGVTCIEFGFIKRRPRARAPKAAQCQPGIISGKRFLSRVRAAGSPGARGSQILETQLFKLQKRTRAADNFRPSYTQLKRPLSGKRARTQRSGKHIDFVGRYRKSR